MDKNRLRWSTGWLKAVCAIYMLCAIALHAQTLTTLVTFAGASGSNPQGSLVQGTDGNFYGTTVEGGNTSCDPPNGCGTVFKVTPSGVLTILYSFCAQTNCADGSSPYGGLVLGTDGNFYGATPNGGAHNGGTIFRITLLGKLITLYSFCSEANCSDGEAAPSALIEASDGDFYRDRVWRSAWCWNDL